MQQLTTIAQSIITFINSVAVPLVFAVAFIVFLFGVFRYYIAGGANAEKRKEGTQLIVYSLIGFAVMLVVWGLVNLIIGTLGLSNTNQPCLPTFTTTGNTPCTGNTTGTSNTLNSPSSPVSSPTQTSVSNQTSAPGQVTNISGQGEIPSNFVGPRP